MSDDDDRPRPQLHHPEPVLARQRRWAMAMAIGLVAAMLAARGWYVAESPGDSPRSAAIIELRGGIDPNTADWHTLSLLPGVGETLARRIVAYREQHRAESDEEGPVFRTPADLTAVSGIGEKTILRIGQFLRFDRATSTATIEPATNGNGRDPSRER